MCSIEYLRTRSHIYGSIAAFGRYFVRGAISLLLLILRSLEKVQLRKTIEAENGHNNTLRSKH